MTVIARKGSEVGLITRSHFNELVETNPRISLLHTLAKEVRALDHSIRVAKNTFAFSPAEAK